MSLASQQKQINQILTNTQNHLKQVNSKINLLQNEKSSIDEDISILTHRLQLMKIQLQKKKQAYEVVNSLYEESDEAYDKLKQSTKTLLMAFKKQDKKVNHMIKEAEKSTIEGGN